MITTINWKTNRVTDILPEEFYALINMNREHIRKTFPVTLAGCDDIEKTKEFIGKAKENEQNKENYYFYLRNTDSNALIGFICIKSIDPKIAKCELAYFVDLAFEGRGIIT